MLKRCDAFQGIVREGSVRILISVVPTAAEESLVPFVSRIKEEGHFASLPSLWQLTLKFAQLPVCF